MDDIFFNVTNLEPGRNLYLESAARVDEWFLMQNPYLVIWIIIFYLTFALKIGPDFMKDRQPYDLRVIMVGYNIFQTVYNTFMVLKPFTITNSLPYLVHHTCHPIPEAVNPFWDHFNAGVWYYVMSKLFDLSDTVFMVLRKKQSHITFLHVYHHTSVLATAWFFLKYVKGQQGVFVGWLNSLVHMVMYTYYYLSVFGPSVQKHLVKYKKYITQLQMIQFVIMFVYFITIQLNDCELPVIFNYFGAVYALTFFGLFYDFYKTSYLKNNSHANEKKDVQNSAA